MLFYFLLYGKSLTVKKDYPLLLLLAKSKHKAVISSIKPDTINKEPLTSISQCNILARAPKTISTTPAINKITLVFISLFKFVYTYNIIYNHKIR